MITRSDPPAAPLPPETTMTPEELRQFLEEAFGNLEPPPLDEVCEAYDMDGFESALRTETGRSKPWQELRPLGQYQRYPAVDLSAEVDWERERIDRMLEKYWRAWL